MYKEHYHLKELPFSLLPDPAFLYLSQQHKTALTMLNYGIQSQAIISIISGDIGSGKTTLVRRILHEMPEDISVGLMSTAHCSFNNLLEWILIAFDIENTAKKQDKISLYQLFTDFLISEYSKNKRTILIIDEAQNLDSETLEELRLLSNINTDKHLILQLILVGQPELLTRIQRPELRQLAQRISVDYQLKPLTYQETVAYIEHRVITAGGDNDLFNQYASAIIYYYSQGIPRLINTLADFCLVYGFAENKSQIDADIAIEVIKNKLNNGVFPAPQQISEEQLKIQEIIKNDINLDIVAALSENGNNKPIYNENKLIASS